MSQNRRRRHRRHSPFLDRRWLRSAFLLKAVGFTVASIVLIGFIATTTLPDALVHSDPDLALTLSPNHSPALIAKAERLKARLFSGTLPIRSDGPDSTPEPWPDPRDELRRQIRQLALAAHAADPLNATAFRLLGELSGDVETTRRMMQGAVARRRRDYIAVFWLLNDAVQRADTSATIDYAEILIRTRPELAGFTTSVLAPLADDEGKRDSLLQWLARPSNASLRSTFLRYVPGRTSDIETPLAVMRSLRDRNLSLSTIEIKPYLDFLIAKGHLEVARTAWRELSQAGASASADTIVNGDFEADTSGLAFDWTIAQPRNATAEIRRRDDGQGRALQLRFNGGRAEIPKLQQTLFAAPGSYRFTFSTTGAIASQRGLRWRMSCLYGKRPRVFETDMLLGPEATWRTIAIDVTIPDEPDCRGQTLALIHDARSASEQLISGEFWFDDVRLIALPPPATAPD